MRIAIVDDDPAEKDQLIVIDSFAFRMVDWEPGWVQAVTNMLRTHIDKSEKDWLKGKLQ
jgi:hypothetical protein